MCASPEQYRCIFKFFLTRVNAPRSKNVHLLQQCRVRVLWTSFAQRSHWYNCGHSQCAMPSKPPTRLVKLQTMLFASSLPRSGCTAPSRVDAMLIVGLLVITTIMETSVLPHVQPVHLDDPTLRKPMLPDTVTTTQVLVLSFIIPPVLYTTSQWTYATLLFPFPPLLFTTGLFEANIITMFLTNIFKLLVGRPRPYFVAACKSYIQGSSTECTGDVLVVKDARRSFPSGHSSLSFSAAMFFTLSLWAALSPTNADVVHKMARLVVLMLPLLVASLIAASRLIDFHHHYSDVIAGSCLGAVTAYAVFITRAGVPLMNAQPSVSVNNTEIESCADHAIDMPHVDTV